MNNTITIESKISNTGSIYDLESEHYDITIKMGKSYQYIVILPSYFNATPTRHRTAGGALREYHKLARLGYTQQVILDRDGDYIDYHELLRAMWDADNV
jgi:hypothetical protein